MLPQTQSIIDLVATSTEDKQVWATFVYGQNERDGLTVKEAATIVKRVQDALAASECADMNDDTTCYVAIFHDAYHIDNVSHPVVIAELVANL